MPEGTSGVRRADCSACGGSGRKTTDGTVSGIKHDVPCHRCKRAGFSIHEEEEQMEDATWTPVPGDRVHHLVVDDMGTVLSTPQGRGVEVKWDRGVTGQANTSDLEYAGLAPLDAETNVALLTRRLEVARQDDRAIRAQIAPVLDAIDAIVPQSYPDLHPSLEHLYRVGQAMRRWLSLTPDERL